MNIVRVFHRVCVPLTKNSVPINLFKQTAACYSVKYQHRRPTKIYNPDGESDVNEEAPKRIVTKSSKNDEIRGVIELDKNFSLKNKKQPRDALDSEEQSFEEESDYESDGTIGTEYARLGDSDRTFDRRMIKVQSKKQRDKNNIIMLEGKRLIQDAISANIIPTEIFFTRKSLIEDLVMPPGVIKLYKMPYNKMKVWSPLQAPPGIVAFCRMPKNYLPKPKNTIPLTVICDNVREPGNMGTILRTVAGVGCVKVLLTKGCVDLWDSKTLRAAAGAHFYVPIETGLTWDEISEKLDGDTNIFIAHHNEENETIEGHSIPTIPYFSVTYSRLSDITVIVGGETEGISDDAINFARYRDGVKINIPLNSNIDSLNVGAAISTILFEIKRQFIVNKKLHVDYDSNNNRSSTNDNVSLNR